MHGKHCLRHYCKQQTCVALSSGEAELYGISRAACEGLGLQTAAYELGYQFRVSVLPFSSAAKGTLNRRGSGRLKHIKTTKLWQISANGHSSSNFPG